MNTETIIQPILPYNYIWFNNKVLSASQTDEYNRYTNTINKEFYSESKNYLKDNRNKFLKLCFRGLN